MKKTGNTILITGGSSGIGLALTRKFLENNNTVIIAGRSREKLEKVRRHIGDIPLFQADLSTPEGPESLVINVNKQFPDLNVLINSAGQQHNYYLTEETIPWKKIDSEINVNFTSVVKLSVMLLPQLASKPDSAIVNISSALGLAPKENAPVYCPTKAAVHNFTRILRYQLEKTGVKVFDIMPPVVDTPMTAGRESIKISADEVAESFMEAWVKNRYEAVIGKASLVKILLRLFPEFTLKKLRYKF